MGTYAIEVTELNFDVISDLRGKKNAILTTNLVVIFVFFEMIATKKFPTVTVIYVDNDDKPLILLLGKKFSKFANKQYMKLQGGSAP